jgi:hypothetical protein
MNPGYENITRQHRKKYQMVDAMYDGIARLDETQILASAPIAGGVQ